MRTVVGVALQSILNLTRTRTQTFDACALRQIAIPLLALRGSYRAIMKITVWQRTRKKNP